MSQFPVPPDQAEALFDSMINACDAMMLAIQQTKQANQALADAISSPRLQFPITRENYSAQAEYIKQREASIRDAQALVEQRGREYNDAYHYTIKHLEALGIRDLIALGGEGIIEIKVGRYLIRAGMSEDKVVFKIADTEEK